MYTAEEQQIMLHIAREALTAAAAQLDRPKITLDTLPPSLRDERACFVTLNEHGEQRGCTGTVFPRRALGEEISVSAVHSAIYDPRFAPVTPDEVPLIQIEISVLTLPTVLNFATPAELISQLRRGVDGVLIQKSGMRATYLPQVWDNFSNAADFLASLCRKAGLPADTWKQPGMKAEVYQTIVFEEHVSNH